MRMLSATLIFCFLSFPAISWAQDQRPAQQQIGQGSERLQGSITKRHENWQALPQEEKDYIKKNRRQNRQERRDQARENYQNLSPDRQEKVQKRLQQKRELRQSRRERRRETYNR